MRGFAVLGILLANISAFAHPELAYYWPPALPGGGTASDGWIWLAQFTLVDGKFRGLFTLLFGIGLALFVARAGGGAPAIVLQVRRLAWLALFGVLHFYLLFPGDILFAYATGGAVALLAIGWNARTLVTVGVLVALAGGLLQTLNFLGPALIEAQALAGTGVPEGWPALQTFWAGVVADSAVQARAMAGPSLAGLVGWRWDENSWRLGYTLTHNFFETIPLILIGMGLYRGGLFTKPMLRQHWRGFAWAGVAVGLALNFGIGLYVLRAGFPPFQTQAAFFGLSLLTNLPLLLGAIVLLPEAALAIRDDWLGERLGDAGRMAFSNYIGTSLVMALMFQGWAGARFAQMPRAELLLVVVMGWAMMIAASRLWLARFRHGPLEWLWRCLTYRRIVPNRC